MTNILKLPIQNSNSTFFSRFFYYAFFLMSRKTETHYNDVSSKVLTQPRVLDAINFLVKEDLKEERKKGPIIDEEYLIEKLKKKHKLQAVLILNRMKSCVSSSLLRIAGWILYKLLNKILNAIHFHKDQIETLKKVSETKLPIIYLPLHRSHLDYILVSFILYMNDIKPPLVAAGENLLIPFFGNLMRGLGAFFIKRKLEPSNCKKDQIYRSILRAYIEENLKEGHSLEFFLEGGRSRSGKCCYPKAGLLSFVVDSVLEKVVSDVYIVPVGISYEKLIDGNFNSEQMGEAKIAENFSLAAKAIWSKLHSKFGNVKIDFCEPFSLKNYLHSIKISEDNLNHQHFQKRLLPCVVCCSNKLLSPFQIYPSNLVLNLNKRETINKLAEHVVHDAFKTTSIMSTQLLCFLLLNKFRKGASLQLLIENVNWLRKELERRKKVISFAGESCDLLKQAFTSLGKDLISVVTFSMAWSKKNQIENNASGNYSLNNTNNNNNCKITYIKPVTKWPHVLELNYYSNCCISIFLIDSIVANALFAIVELYSTCSLETQQKTFFKKNIINKCLELCSILQHDFIFYPPCKNLINLIDETIESFISNGLLVNIESKKLGKSHDTLKTLKFDEDDGYIDEKKNKLYDVSLKVSSTDENINRLRFYKSILGSFIESYWLVACGLLKLIHKQKEDKRFLVEIITLAKDMLNKGLLFYEESIAAETIRNGIKLFETWKVIEYETIKSIKVIYLRKKFDNEKSVNELIYHIEKFKKNEPQFLKKPF